MNLKKKFAKFQNLEKMDSKFLKFKIEILMKKGNEN